jgi:coenzyme F420-reducing hydrogenase gamma subunit
MSFLDLDEDLVGILSKIELTFTPITDFKITLPELDVGIIEEASERRAPGGGAQARESCKIQVAWGCAVFGA